MPETQGEPAFLFVAAAVKEVDMSGGDLQTTFDDVHQSDQFHVFRDDQLLLPRVLFNVGTAKPSANHLCLSTALFVHMSIDRWPLKNWYCTACLADTIPSRTNSLE